jgi:hypothetical protein
MYKSLDGARQRREKLPHQKQHVRDNDVVGGEIETPIALVISGVSEEYTMSGKCASAHMRVRRRKERHTARRR